MFSKGPPDGRIPQETGGVDDKPAVNALGRPEGWSMDTNAMSKPAVGGALFGQQTAQSGPPPGAVLCGAIINFKI